MSEQLKTILIWGSACIAVCSVFYLGTNRLAEFLPHHYQMYFEWEKDIPLVPWMIVVYASLYALIPAGFLLVRSSEVVKKMSQSLILSAMVASVVFVVFPGELGFVRGEVPGVFSGAFELMCQMDKPFNLYPSLHIAFSGIVALFVGSTVRSRVARYGFLLWFLLIACSVVLVHQHHLFDVVSGAVLGWGCWKWGQGCPQPFNKRAASNSQGSPS
jgi:membrane-associated phospholipid phosphatase